MISSKEKGTGDGGTSWVPKDNWRVFLQTLKSVSVEPVAMILMTSVLMQYLVYQNFQIENICLVTRNNSKEICKQIVNVNSSYADEELEIQKIAAQLRTYRSILDHSFPLIFVVFLGPWSDHYGRKIPILIALIGFTFKSIIHILASLYADQVDPYLINILTGLPRALTGGETVFQMAAYSYICDITSHKPRTVRTGMLNAALTLGVPLGFTLGGRIISSGMSYTKAFSIGLGLMLMALVFAIFRVTNTNQEDRLRLEHEDDEDGDDNGPKKDKGQGQGQGQKERPSFWSIINPKNNFYGVFSLPFKKREDYGRLKMFLLLISYVCVTAPIHGEFGVMYLFLRERLGWGAVSYGYFSSYNWFIGVLGVIISMGIFLKWMGLKDQTVGFITGISQMSGCFVYAFATTGPLIYIASSVDMLNGTMVVIVKSMLSKLVNGDEIGKLFSLIAVLETLVPLAMDPLYSTIYRLTVSSFSGWFFIMSAIFTLPPQLVFLWLMCRRGTQKWDPNVNVIKGQTNLGFVKEVKGIE